MAEELKEQALTNSMVKTRRPLLGSFIDVSFFEVSCSNKRLTKPFVGPGSLRARPQSEAPEEKLLGIPSKNSLSD
jgi:hypothetical protein